jgi:hypothetical protein
MSHEVAIVANRNRAQKHVIRDRIILCSAERLNVAEIARLAEVSRPVVWRWQRRFADAGVDGLLRDKTREPGKAPVPGDRPFPWRPDYQGWRWSMRLVTSSAQFCCPAGAMTASASNRCSMVLPLTVEGQSAGVRLPRLSYWFLKSSGQRPKSQMV